MTSIKRLFLAYLDEMDLITILLPLSYYQGVSGTFSLIDEAETTALEIIEKETIDSNIKYICRIHQELNLGKTYWILDERGGRTDLQMGAVIRTKKFDELFYYDGDDLGVQCDPGQTYFKVWAPTATQVKVKLRQPDRSFSEMIKLKREEKGIWSAVVNRDLEYYQYSYLVFINQEWREAVDPYANAVTANGELGVVVKMEKTKRIKPVLPPLASPVDAIIYETHIRDFSIHPKSGINNKGLYLGVGEEGTRGANGQITGLSYLKDLGITHLELMPFHDFAGVNELDPTNSYNWGYNPIHYNVPEGSYSTDPANPYARITELKRMISLVQQNGLRVIMDAVYNHVYIRETSSFEKLVPGYYFRHNEFGLPSNGTGVGNDFASERKMVRKFIIDSVRFWLNEYHVDGFRFDLMGILDVETMNEVKKVCAEVSPDIILIGEGWNLNTPLPLEQKAIIRNQGKMPQIAQFNDRFRDAIKGSTFNLYEKGFCLGNGHFYEQACEAISGSVGFNLSKMFNEPTQTVNYVECHDNHTLWDKLRACYPEWDEETRQKYHRLATGMVILSQGIPFLHSGQEFFRTKNGEGNSYRSPDPINQLDWERMSQFQENVEYIKGLIKIRQSFSCFRLRTAKEIREKMSLLPLEPPVIGFIYRDQTELLLLLNPSQKETIIPLPGGEWFVLADEKRVEISYNRPHAGGNMSINPISLNILVKK